MKDSGPTEGNAEQVPTRPRVPAKVSSDSRVGSTNETSTGAGYGTPAGLSQRFHLKVAYGHHGIYEFQSTADYSDSDADRLVRELRRSGVNAWRVEV